LKFSLVRQLFEIDIAIKNQKMPRQQILLTEGLNKLFSRKCWSFEKIVFEKLRNLNIRFFINDFHQVESFQNINKKINAKVKKVKNYQKRPFEDFFRNLEKKKNFVKTIFFCGAL
jgi:hypothetical protein